MIPFEQELELYHYAESLCSQKARIGLAEKALPYKSHHILICDVAQECQNLDEDYLRVNPKGIVPTLVHKGLPVYDAHRIIRYLDETFPGSGAPLWPKDAAGAKIAEFWFDEGMLKDDQPLGANFGTGIAMLTHPLLAHMLKRQPLELVERKYERHPIEQRREGFVAMRKGFEPPPAVVEGAMQRIADGLRTLDAQLDGSAGQFAAGEFSLVDITMMACLHRLQDLALDSLLGSEKLQQVGDYWRRLQSRPSYQTAVLGWHDEENWRSAIAELYGDGESPLLQQMNDILERKT